MMQNSTIPINVTDANGWTPLHMACIISANRKCHELIDKLLRHPEVDVNARDNSNATPLQIVVTMSSPIIAVEKLLNHPFIDINQK